jgi:hypothetical protein
LDFGFVLIRQGKVRPHQEEEENDEKIVWLFAIFVKSL